MFRFATVEDLKVLMPLFFHIHSAIINNGWENHGGPDNKLQVYYEKGSKKFDILPLYDAHIEPYDGWCFEAMRHDNKDLDIFFLNSEDDIPNLIEYINQ